MIQHRWTPAEKLLFIPAFTLLFIFIGLMFVLSLPVPNRLALLGLLVVGAVTLAYLFYRTLQIGLRRQYPLAPLLSLGLDLAGVYILHPYFPAVDLPLFLTVAGTGVLWGLQAGLLFGAAAAVSYFAVLLAVDPSFSTVGAIVFGLHLVFIGAITGLLTRQEQRQRAEIEAINAHNTQLAQALQRLNTALEARVAASDSEVRQAQLLQEELYEMITHDLKSPLGTIVSALLILRDTLPPEAHNAHQAISAALKAGDRQLELIENLLDVQRLRSGVLPLNLERVDLGLVLQELVEQFEPRVERKSIQLEKRFALPLPPVRTDRLLISRVISNLLENAYKFTPPSGRITVDAKAQTRMLRVIVADTGPGVPGPHRQAIFEKYRRVNADDPARDGTGLGLAFCKMAVQALGGEITVGSSPSGGAQFEFTLPLAGPE